MAKIMVDFSDVPASFIPAGPYEAVVNKVELKTSKDETGQYLLWEFEGVEGEAAGRKFPMMTSLKPAALFGLRDAFDTLGLDASALAEIEVDEESGLMLDPDLTGMPVQISVIIDSYGGIQRNKAQKILECHRPFGQDDEELVDAVEGSAAADHEAQLDDIKPDMPEQATLGGEFEVIGGGPDMTGYENLDIPDDSSGDEEPV